MAESLEGSPADDELQVANRDYEKLLTAYENVGYSDGVVAGEDSALQHGFNQGFVQGFRQMMKITRIKGMISALQAYQQNDDVGIRRSPAGISNMEILLTRITELETTTIQNIQNIPNESRLKDSGKDNENTKSSSSNQLDKCNKTSCCRESNTTAVDDDNDNNDRKTQYSCGKESGYVCNNDEKAITKKCDNLADESVENNLSNLNEVLTTIVGELKQVLQDYDIKIYSAMAQFLDVS
ncbi:uncharacterized protein TRIADDRAFT_54923 [Trichoplax adhaerens]|uniref:Essential protein Yae1 N-terminal domain-containing protein n=1 Tax=Trichoplax adhaerens TaxID=10228 RepID=B3RTD4_TRIAD|nr:predicted protein [Trichoplax adhaerens]EDV26675.1 predicted protein [Trichoplax adhaerens]|eukprot:XP_002110671.1 predicted protein [Trichoplax adhaerens]